MISKTVVVNLPADAEARPVAVLVQIASKYESKITINSQNRRNQCEKHHGNDEPWIR